MNRSRTPSHQDHHENTRPSSSTVNFRKSFIFHISRSNSHRSLSRCEVFKHGAPRAARYHTLAHPAGTVPATSIPSHRRPGVSTYVVVVQQQVGPARKTSSAKEGSHDKFRCEGTWRRRAGRASWRTWETARRTVVIRVASSQAVHPSPQPQSRRASISSLVMGTNLSRSIPRAASAGRAWDGTNRWFNSGATESS